MADFLSRLAGQALGMAPAIQPLGTPMYAPGRAPDGAAGGAWGNALSATEWAGEERAEAEALGALYSTGEAPSYPSLAPRLLAPRLDEPWDAAPSAPPLRPSPPAPSAPARPSTRLDAVGPNADPASAPPLRDPVNWRDVLLGQRPPAPTLRAAPPERGANEPDGTRASAPSDGPAHPFGLAEPDGRFDALPRATAWPALLMPRRAAPTMSPAADASMPPAASGAGETAPTVQVTIGRIDVRAIMPPAPAPRAAPAHPMPALTLDEYLKRQNGGRR